MPEMNALLTTKEVCKLLGISRWTLSNMVKKKIFPEPIQLSESIKRWMSKDVTDFILNKASKREK